MTEKPVMQRVSEIVADLKEVVTDELQLTMAQVKGPATEAGVGAGLLGAAGVLAINTVPLFALLFVTLFAWLYSNWLPIFPSIALGFTTAAVLLLLVAGILALVGKRKTDRLAEVKPTIEASKARLLATVDLAKESVESGKQKVAELGSSSAQQLDLTSP